MFKFQLQIKVNINSLYLATVEIKLLTISLYRTSVTKHWLNIGNCQLFQHEREKLDKNVYSRFAKWSKIFTMMTSSNGNIFRVTGPLCGKFTGDRWIPLTRPVTQSFDVFFIIYAWINGWVNNHAGDLRRHRVHYDVIVMWIRSIGKDQSTTRLIRIWH